MDTEVCGVLPLTDRLLEQGHAVEYTEAGSDTDYTGEVGNDSSPDFLFEGDGEVLPVDVGGLWGSDSDGNCALDLFLGIAEVFEDKSLEKIHSEGCLNEFYVLVLFESNECCSATFESLFCIKFFLVVEIRLGLELLGI